MLDEKNTLSSLTTKENTWVNVLFGSLLTSLGFHVATALKQMRSEITGNTKGIKSLAILGLSTLALGVISIFKVSSLDKLRKKKEAEIAKLEHREETLSIVKEALAQQEDKSEAKNSWQEKQLEKKILAETQDSALAK